VPGRHEPGTGQQPIREFLSDLDDVGYAGSVGLEYRPSGDTEAALSWLPREARG
jgi:hydroxypyruvate isomerase